jgi:hypothetical protein
MNNSMIKDISRRDFICASAAAANINLTCEALFGAHANAQQPVIPGAFQLVRAESIRDSIEVLRERPGNKAGDRVKTDRRDAERLARSYRSGDLTAVWVPDEGPEALRDLVRAREAAKQDELRARHRLGKFLLRSGHRPPTGIRSWTHLHLIWVSQIRFVQAAQESTRLDYLHEVEHMRFAQIPRDVIQISAGVVSMKISAGVVSMPTASARAGSRNGQLLAR